MRKGELNLLNIRGVLPESEVPLSVKETAHKLIQFLKILSDFDPMFSSFTPLKRDTIGMDISALGIKGATDSLTSYFLETTNWKDNVPTWDIRDNPDQNTSISTGFPFNFGFSEDGESRLSVTGNISCVTKRFPRVIFLQYFNQRTDHTYPFSWYERILKDLVKFWCPQEAMIGTVSWTQMNLKSGLGRISYFADDYEHFEIPNDLSGVDYLQADGGRYLYICPKFTPDLDEFLEHETVTKAAMEELRSRVPAYTKPPR